MPRMRLHYQYNCLNFKSTSCFMNISSSFPQSTSDTLKRPKTDPTLSHGNLRYVPLVLHTVPSLFGRQTGIYNGGGGVLFETLGVHTAGLGQLVTRIVPRYCHPGGLLSCSFPFLPQKSMSSSDTMLERCRQRERGRTTAAMVDEKVTALHRLCVATSLTLAQQCSTFNCSSLIPHTIQVLIIYLLSCHTFTPIEKRAIFFQIARFL